MFHAFPGEVMFGTVVGTSPLGVFLMCGAGMQVFVGSALCAEGITWDGKRESKIQGLKRLLKEKERRERAERGEVEGGWGGDGDGTGRSIRINDGVLVRITAVTRQGDKLQGVGDMSGDYTGFASRSYSMPSPPTRSYPIETLNLPVANGVNHPYYYNRPF